MEEAGIDCSIILPVVTRPKQFRTVNSYAAKITNRERNNGLKVISFGGLHPDSENWKEELKEIKNMGLLGIKLHPDYQNVFIDDIRYLRILDYASEIGLIMVVHAGLDVGLPKVIHCTPKRVKKMLKEIKPENLVLAHTGGFGCWDEVEELLVETDLYFDISYSLGFIKEEQLIRIIRNHGAKKILFASDSPWGNQKQMLEQFYNLSLTEEEKKLILSENAIKLLEK